MVYVGALAYTLSACTTTYKLPTSPQKEFYIQEVNGLEVGLRYEGVTKEWVSFSTVLSNYSDKSIEIQPEKIYVEGTNNLPALNPEQKIAEYKQRIISREEANQAGKVLLIVLGIVLVVGLIALAVSEDIKESKAEKSSNTSQAPRNSYSSSTSQNFSSRRNNSHEFRQSNLGAVLCSVADITVSIASMQRCERNYSAMNGLQRLQFMQAFWENEALRTVTLQPNERVQGLVLFPRKMLKTNSFQLILPFTDTPHKIAVQLR